MILTRRLIEDFEFYTEFFIDDDSIAALSPRTRKQTARKLRYFSQCLSLMAQSASDLSNRISEQETE